MDQRLNHTLRITELYTSIQGESTWAGLPCVFVRLARCNLRCLWCDTPHSLRGGEKWPIRDILRTVAEYDVPLVEITGGEPLAQKHCAALAEFLLERGYEVLVETSGSLPIDVLPAGAIRIMDLKCPGSGMEHRNDWANIGRLNKRDEVKLVMGDRRDYEWSREVLCEHRLHERCHAVLFAPVFGMLAPEQLAGWILEDRLPARLQLQMHKCIWPPDARGV